MCVRGDYLCVCVCMCVYMCWEMENDDYSVNLCVNFGTAPDTLLQGCQKWGGLGPHFSSCF